MVAEPVVEEVEELLVEPHPTEPDALDAYLTKFNSMFGLDATRDGLKNSKQAVMGWLHYLRQQDVLETDIPLLLHDSLQYATYRIAQKFGVLDDDGEPDPLIKYGSVGSRFMEVMER